MLVSISGHGFVTFEDTDIDQEGGGAEVKSEFPVTLIRKYKKLAYVKKLIGFE